MHIFLFSLILIFFFFLLLEGISETTPRVIDENKAKKLASELKRCSYYETCSTYGLNVEKVFQEGN